MGRIRGSSLLPRLGAAAGIAVLTALLAACSSGSEPAGGVAVTTADATLDAFDQTTQMTAVALDRNGRPIAGTTFTWSSGNPAIATVDANGLVTAHGNGTATITATSDRSWPGSHDVVVEQVPVAVTISPADWPSTDAWVGARRQFSAVTTDANDYPIAAAEVVWSSSDGTVVEIDDTGLATAMDVGEDIVISAASGAASDFTGVTVPPEVSHRPGNMYTVWFARSDSAPALLVDGQLEVPDDIITSVSYEHPVAPWPHALPGEYVARPTIHKFQWEGDRIGLLTDVAHGAGTVRVLDRVGDWTIMALADGIDFQLEGDRIGVLHEGGRFRAKDGVHNPWVVMADAGAVQFLLEGDRIGVLYDDGLFRAKDGLHGAWTILANPGTGVREFQLAGDRIGVLYDDGLLRVKDGMDGAWTVLATDAAGFRLHGDRIALLHEDGRLRVKDGIHGAWTVLATEPIRQYELEGDRIGILFESGVFQAKDGIHGPWFVIATEDVREFQLQGNRVGVLLQNGMLRVKVGLSPANFFSDTDANGSGVTQFRLVVSVPVPPFRTTNAYYDTRQAQCRNYDQSTGNDCYHVPHFDLPVSNYGWFCGAGRPENFHAIMSAHLAQLTDGLDALCRHHDVMDTWYPGARAFWSGNWAGGCIVRYGLVNSRLTRNGVLLADGSSSNATWNAAWESVGMVNLKDSLDNYFDHTAGCTDASLRSFTEHTASQN